MTGSPLSCMIHCCCSVSGTACLPVTRNDGGSQIKYPLSFLLFCHDHDQHEDGGVSRSCVCLVKREKKGMHPCITVCCLLVCVCSACFQLLSVSSDLRRRRSKVKHVLISCQGRGMMKEKERERHVLHEAARAAAAACNTIVCRHRSHTATADASSTTKTGST